MQAPRAIPDVSVIVRSMDRPVLPRALASIASQDAPAVSAEVLVVAACGPAHAPVPAAIGPFEGRLVTGAGPLSRPRAANAGLDAARGRHIAFLDDDDEMLPDHFSSFLGQFDADPATEFVHARSVAVDAQGRELYVYGGPFIAWRQLDHGFFQLGAVMMKREVLARGVRFDESLDILEDLEFFVQCAQVATFRYLPRPVSRYHVAEGTSGTGVEGNRDLERLRGPLDYIAAKWRTLGEALRASPPARRDRARERLQRGEFAAAIDEVRALAESDDPDALNLMAIAHARMGDVDRARALLADALRRLPGNASLLRNLERLDDLR